MSWIKGTPGSRHEDKKSSNGNGTAESLQKIKVKMEAGLDNVQTLTIQEVALVLSISESKAYEITDPDTGELSALRIAGSIRVKVSDLKKYMSPQK